MKQVWYLLGFNSKTVVLRKLFEAGTNYFYEEQPFYSLECMRSQTMGEHIWNALFSEDSCGWCCKSVHPGVVVLYMVWHYMYRYHDT